MEKYWFIIILSVLCIVIKWVWNIFEPFKADIKPLKGDSKFIFLTFGGGQPKFYDAVDRIIREAKSMEVFDETVGITDKTLKRDSFFWDKMGTFIQNNSRGYGYWCWKFYIILKQLEKMNDQDIIVYCDSGCELNLNGRNKLIRNYFVKAKKNDILLSFACAEGQCTNRKWTKKKVVDYFNLSSEKLDQLQYAATFLIVRKTSKTFIFFKELVNLILEKPEMLTDQVSNEEDKLFVEHRHDQSLLCCKLITSDLKYEAIIDGGKVTDKSQFENEPIICSRRRNG